MPGASRTADAGEAPVKASVLVFARAPVPAQVKTRLIPALGAEGAARLHESLVERTLESARGAAARLELWTAPDTSHPFFSRCADRYGATLHVQCGNDLGERMAHAFDQALTRASRSVLVGSDIPLLDAGYMKRAFDALDAAPVVFGPAEDGGYVLVGLGKRAPGLFFGIDWGTGEVMAQTRARLRALGLGWRELEPLWDVDRPEDLARLRP